MRDLEKDINPLKDLFSRTIDIITASIGKSYDLYIKIQTVVLCFMGPLRNFLLLIINKDGKCT